MSAAPARRLSKTQRETLRMKFGGKCAYCGSQLLDRWHADHREPIYRDGKTMLHKDRDTIENLMPSCAPCNIAKGPYSVEGFRREITASVSYLERNNSTYRTGKRFLRIRETSDPVVFHFERYANQEPST